MWPSNSKLCVINKEDGSFVEIMQKCRKCGCVKTWTSQSYTRRLPADYILISCAILLSGALPSRVLKVLSFNNLLSISPSTFHHHQKGYIASAVMAEWLDAQAQIMDELREIDIRRCLVRQSWTLCKVWLLQFVGELSEQNTGCPAGAGIYHISMIKYYSPTSKNH